MYQLMATLLQKTLYNVSFDGYIVSSDNDINVHNVSNCIFIVSFWYNLSIDIYNVYLQCYLYRLVFVFNIFSTFHWH